MGQTQAKIILCPDPTGSSRYRATPGAEIPDSIHAPGVDGASYDPAGLMIIPAVPRKISVAAVDAAAAPPSCRVRGVPAGLGLRPVADPAPG